MASQGEWLEDNFVGDFGACDATTALMAVKAAETVAEQARDFMYKPDGGACCRAAAGAARACAGKLTQLLAHDMQM